MIDPPEQSAERDAVLAVLPAQVPAHGWTFSAARAALRSLGASPDDAERLFPGGAPDMIEGFCDWSDRGMQEAAGQLDLAAMRVPARVRSLIALRLAAQRDHKEAVRRALGVLALPRHVRLAATCTARSVDAIWHAAGDRAADFSWYTKRATLAGVYTATVLFWVQDDSEDDARTLTFLDRRLADIGRIGRLRRRLPAR